MPDLSPSVIAHYAAMSMARGVAVELTLRSGRTVSGRIGERVEVPPRDGCGLEVRFVGQDYGVHLADVVDIKSLPS